jgi:hypothetical protein
MTPARIAAGEPERARCRTNPINRNVRGNTPAHPERPGGTEEEGTITMSVRKRAWTTSKGETKEAWIVDYVDQKGERHISTCLDKAIFFDL